MADSPFVLVVRSGRSSTRWPVVPLCSAQGMDVQVADTCYVPYGGRFPDGTGAVNLPLYRVVRARRSKVTDHLPEIIARRMREVGHKVQFVVQLHGCPLDCPYCYVTRAGVWNDPVRVATEDLVQHFYTHAVRKHGASVFHLMGGAPALYLEHWPELLAELEDSFGRRPVGVPWVFHSDLLLAEGIYSAKALRTAAHERAVYAVNIKGCSPETFRKNTGKDLPEYWWQNLQAVLDSGISFYLTFTGTTGAERAGFWKEAARQYSASEVERLTADNFSIDVVRYSATRYNHLTPWGGRRGRSTHAS